MIKRTSQEIRRLNRFEVLRRVYAAPGAITRQDIAAASQLSFATVSNLVAELLEAGVLVDAGHDASNGGRPRARLAVNADRGLLIGVDVAETTVHAELFDLALHVRHAVARELPQGEVRPADVVEHLGAVVRDLLAKPGVSPECVLGAGISVPGMVEPQGGVSTFSPYWSWHDVPLRTLLAKHLGVPVHIDNPLKASTVAEMWFGAGRDVDNLVVVTLRAGVGAGIAIDGTLYRGSANSAGEWGHTCLVLEGRPCRCGGLGCVESYVSTGGILRTWREVSGGAAATGLPLRAESLDTLARRAAEDDPAAVTAVEMSARYLGAALANLINLFNPDVLVLGDQVVERLGEPLLSRTRDALARHVLPLPLRTVRLERSSLPYNTVTCGAATFALEGFLNDREVFGPVSRARRLAGGTGY